MKRARPTHGDRELSLHHPRGQEAQPAAHGTHPFGLIRRLRKEDDTEQFFGLIEGVAGAKDLAVIDTMTQAEVKDLMAAWQKDSSITLGESSDS